MNKLFFSLFLFLCCSFSAWTQVSAGPTFVLNFSDVIGGVDAAVENKFIIGFRAGAFLEIKINDALALQPEVLYSTRGYKQHTSVAAQDTNLRYIFSYIDFPVLLRINIGENLYWNHLHIGSQIGYLISAREKGEITVSNTTVSIDTSNVYGFNTTEYSIVIGGGFEFPFGLTASFRVTYGISKLYVGDYSSHNLSFHVSAGYKFGSKGNGKSRSGVMYKNMYKRM